MSKRNKDYWQKRAIDIVEITQDEMFKGITSRMKSSYEEALVDINSDILKLYATFGKDNNMNFEDSQKLLEGPAFRRWRKKLEEYQKLINKETDVYKQRVLQLELNALAMRSRITRLEALEAEIKMAVTKLAHEEEGLLEGGMREVYKENYYRKIYEAYKDENTKAIEMSINKLVAVDDKAVMVALSLPWSGANYSERIWHRSYNVSEKVSGAVTRHLQSGRDVRELIKEISDGLEDISKYNVERLVQTELTFARCQADLKMYEDLDVTEYRYLATLDRKTSEACQRLDGKVFKIEDAVPGTNYPPMHPHCRSTTVLEIEGEGRRAARGEDGKTYKVDRNISYEEWYNKYVENELETNGKGYKITEEDKIYENMSDDEIDRFFNSQKNYTKWKSKLSAEDKVAIDTYTKSDYEAINEILRIGKKAHIERVHKNFNYNPEELPFIESTTDERIRVIERLKTALKGYETEKAFKVYRGTGISVKDYYEGLKPGMITELDKAYMSSSLKKSEIEDFQNNMKNYEFEITVPTGYTNGAYISELSDIPEEKEFVFNPGSKFKIISIDDTDIITKIIMEAVM